MRVVAFNGSPRTNGNTDRALDMVISPLRERGVRVDKVQLGAERLSPCNACMACARRGDGECILRKDALNDLLGRMVAADGVIIASPTYFGGVTPQVKALIDRAGTVARANGMLLRGKAGAAIAVHARAGGLSALDQIHHFLLTQGMVVPGTSRFTTVLGREPGEVDGDEEGREAMAELGEAMAWLLERLG